MSKEEIKTNKKEPKAFITNYKRFLIILAICLIINGVASFLFFNYLRSSGEKIKVPDLKKLNLLDAVSLLQKNNLKVNIMAQTSQTTPRFSVISQNPKAGNVVKEGREVILNISSGPAWLDFPNFIGKNINTISSVFKNAADTQKMIFLDKIVYRDSALKAGTIVSQHPKNKKLIKEKVGLTLYVSNGKRFKVPSLNGKTIEEALYILQRKGNFAYELQYKSSSSAMDGKILSQKPAAGTTPSKVEIVHLVVGKWAKRQTDFKIIHYKVPDSLNGKIIKLLHVDNRGSKTVYEGKAFGKQVIIRAIPSYGVSKCIIYEIQGNTRKYVKELSL